MGISRFFHRRAAETAKPLLAPTVRLRGAGSELVDEIDAFMAGRLADHYALAGRPVPTWTLLNRLAHGTLRELQGTDLGLHPHVWVVAERALADRLVGLGRTPYGLRRLQAEVLVPIELALGERSRTERLTTGQVVAAVSQALDAYTSAA